jgi:hypothetical protein
MLHAPLKSILGRYEMNAVSRTPVALPVLGLIAGTRALLGAGIGLLIAERMDTKPRQTLGWALVAIGALSTIPLMMEVFAERKQETAAPNTRTATSAQEPDVYAH